MVFLFLLLAGLTIWALARNPLEHPRVKTKIYEINKQWGEFVAGYHRLARTDAERAVTERMLRDLEAQGMPVPAEPLGARTNRAVPQAQSQVTSASAVQGWTVPEGTKVPHSASISTPKEPLDNTSILLYFGAFLLVAAAGLFVAFGGAAGGVRTFIIAVVAALFYCVGFWLWYDRPKLKQAALAFIGIGIVLAPLIGVAAYNYVFREKGAAVWFATSILCLALYAHAVHVIRHPLLETVFIGAFVSLFESSVAVLTLPVYYYAWGLAAAGIVIQAVQIVRRKPLETGSPSYLSANILLPVSLFVSLNMVVSRGTLQLAVSLLLAAAYYGLIGWQSTGRNRSQMWVAAEALFLGAAVFFAHSVRHDFADSAVALICLAAPQVAWIWRQGRSDMMTWMGTVLLGSLGFAAFLAQSSDVVSLAALIALAVGSAFVWLKQQRVGGYVLAVVSAIGAVLAAVYRVWMPSDLGFTAGLLVLVLVMVQVATLYAVRATTTDTASWRMWFQGMVVFSAGAGFLTVLTGSGGALDVAVQAVIYTSVIATAWVPLILHDNPKLWATLDGLAPALLLLFFLAQYGPFNRPGLSLAVAIGALAWNIGLSLWCHTEQTRAFAGALLLILPVPIAVLAPSLQSAVFFAGAYTIALAVLLLARYLSLRAAGSTKQSGVSYVVAATAAAALALSIAPFAHDRLLSLTTALSVGVFVIVASRFIEKLSSLMVVVPFVVQVGIWSAYTDGQLVAFTAISALASALGYFVYTTSLQQVPHSEGYYVHYASLATAYIPVMVYLGAVSTASLVWALPWAVLLASATTLHAAWNQRQEVREGVGGFVALAVMLVLQYYGLHNVQAYAHILAALFAVYAYWRWRRGEHRVSDSYITATLATVTVPLVLQALGGVAGDLYGWWLLIEQIAIMLVGMTLHKRLMIRWGLWVALAAVLYQLRHLGWAALAVLAVFLIGLAVVRLQRSDRS